jgi:hypothetical protein
LERVFKAVGDAASMSAFRAVDEFPYVCAVLGPSI